MQVATYVGSLLQPAHLAKTWVQPLQEAHCRARCGCVPAQQTTQHPCAVGHEPPARHICDIAEFKVKNNLYAFEAVTIAAWMALRACATDDTASLRTRSRAPASDTYTTQHVQTQGVRAVAEHALCSRCSAEPGCATEGTASLRSRSRASCTAHNTHFAKPLSCATGYSYCGV
jgi:hypothetical protein